MLLWNPILPVLAKTMRLLRPFLPHSDATLLAPALSHARPGPALPCPVLLPNKPAVLVSIEPGETEVMLRREWVFVNLSSQSWLCVCKTAL